MQSTGFRLAGVTSVAVAAVLAATSAQAHHWWGSYKWASDGVNPVDAVVVDNTDVNWQGHVAEAVFDWNQSAWIGAQLAYGDNTGCSFVGGTIQICNDNYGSNGWLGLASIALSGGEIVAGTTKLNDYYFFQERYNTYSWRQLVTCQEIGHDYGLAHQNENFGTDATTSCMEYTSWPADNEHPDFHDYEQLQTIYDGGGGGDGGTDGGDGGGGGKGKGGGKGGGKPDGGGGGNGKGKNKLVLPSVGNTPETWGRPVGYLPNGKPHVFVRDVAGVKFVTHVTWAPDQGPDHDHEH